MPNYLYDNIFMGLTADMGADMVLLHVSLAIVQEKLYKSRAIR